MRPVQPGVAQQRPDVVVPGHQPGGVSRGGRRAPNGFVDRHSCLPAQFCRARRVVHSRVYRTLPSPTCGGSCIEPGEGRDNRAVTWEPELEEMRRREELARAMGGPERVARQHAAGRLTVRERVQRLLDAGSFEEYGGLAGFATYQDDALDQFTPANTVMGTGRIRGR